MRITPLRASAAVIVAGLLVIVAGLLVGDSPTPSTAVPVEEVHPEIVPHPDQGPEVVRGAPGSREQLGLFGGLLVALGTLGLLGTYSAQASRRAREQQRPTATAEPTPV